MNVCKFCAYNDLKSLEPACSKCRVLDATRNVSNFIPRYDISSMLPPCYGMYSSGKEDCFKCNIEIKKACKHIRKERGWECE